MTLPSNHKFTEAVITCYCSSVGTSPVTAYVSSPKRGKIIKVGSILYGAITTADSLVAVAINGGSAIATIDIVQSGSAAGQVNTAFPSTNNYVNEDDSISFAPSGANGSNVAATFFAVIDEAGV
jgi:hypothetical protein